MFKVLHLSLLLLLSSRAIQCLRWVEPIPTSQGQADSVRPERDVKPTQNPGYDLLKRVDSIPASICGWSVGKGLSDSWSVPGTTNTCFFYTDVGVFGSAPNTWTKCVDFTAVSTYSCDNACRSSSRVLFCPPENPFCQTALLGTSYSEFVCIQKSGSTVFLASTYAGQTGPIAFPVYSGTGGISIGTAYPSRYSTQAPSSLGSTTSTPSPSSSLTSTPSASTSPADSSTSSQPIGAIVGGVVGGLIIICVTVIIVALIMRRKRHGNEGLAHETSAQYHPSANPDSQSLYFSKPELEASTTEIPARSFRRGASGRPTGRRNFVPGPAVVYEVEGA